MVGSFKAGIISDERSFLKTTGGKRKSNISPLYTAKPIYKNNKYNSYFNELWN